MKKLCLLSIICSLFCFATKSQTLTVGEYFIDTDPGLGNANGISFAPDDTLNGIQFNINSSAISLGYHYIFFRLRDSNGNWGHNRSERFYVYDNGSIVINPTNTQLITGEYFIDSDPGLGAGNPISFAQNDSISLDSLAVSSTGYAPGYHFVYLRVKDDDNIWGHCRRLRFYIYDNNPIVNNDSVVLVQAEYWVDSVAIPGTGNLISVNSVDTLFYNDSIPGLQLDSGSHVVSVRVKDSNGNWSFVKSDSVRTEYYDVDIRIENRPFTRRGSVDKYSVFIKNRGNKVLFDNFLIAFLDKTEDPHFAPKIVSINGVDVSNVSTIANDNGDEMVPIWIYSIPAQSEIKFDLYLKTKTTTPPRKPLINTFNIWLNPENTYDVTFEENGDLDDIRNSKLFAGYFGLLEAASDSLLLNVADSILIDSLQNFLINQNIYSEPILYNQFTKPIIKNALDTLLNDTLISYFNDFGYKIIKQGYLNIDAFDTSSNSLRVSTMDCNTYNCPVTPCNGLSAPLFPLPKFEVNTPPCEDRCYCKCADGTFKNKTQPHYDFDIIMKGTERNHDVDVDANGKSKWNNDEYLVNAVFGGRITKKVKSVDKEKKLVWTALEIKSCGIPDSFYTYYYHMRDLTSKNVGDTVALWEEIGKVSDVGVPGARHLHVGFRSSSGILDPRCFINGYPILPPKHTPCEDEGPVKCKNNTPATCSAGVGGDPTSASGQCDPNKFKKKCPPVDPIVPLDPNEKVGNEGYAPQRYIKYNDELHYGIFFENTDSATAPAQVVRIVDTLDLTKVDASTFYLESITAGEMLIVLPDSVHIQNLDTIYMEEPINGCFVRAQASFNTSTGVVDFLLTALDTFPPYNQVSGALEGFLPPDTTDFDGNGLVSYKIMPVSTIPDDTVIYNTAYIIFDTNPSIQTGTWFNTIDRIEPISSVSALPTTTYDTIFTVHWSGTDDGAGIIGYDIYAKLSGDTAFTKWLSNTSLDSATYTGVWDSTYQFYSIAYDSVGNVENKVALVEAFTTLQNPVGIHYIFNSNDLKVYPNPTSGKLTIEATLPQDGKLNVEIFDLLSQKLFSLDDEGMNKKYLKKEIDLSNQSDGVYLIRLNNSGHSITKKFILKKN